MFVKLSTFPTQWPKKLEGEWHSTRFDTGRNYFCPNLTINFSSRWNMRTDRPVKSTNIKSGNTRTHLGNNQILISYFNGQNVELRNTQISKEWTKNEFLNICNFFKVFKISILIKNESFSHLKGGKSLHYNNIALPKFFWFFHILGCYLTFG